QGIGHGQAQVVVAVGAEDDLVGTRYLRDQALEDAADLLRGGEADRVRDVDRGGAGGNRRTHDLVQEVFLGTGAVLGGELDVVDVLLRVADALDHALQHLPAAHAQLVLAV